MTMPKGVYYVGDLCYVLGDSWHEVCELTIQNGKCLSGEFTLKDGRRFAMYSTTYGDGIYKDNFSHNLCVDSGSLGCIRLIDCDPSDKLADDIARLGGLHDYAIDFETMMSNGTIYLGDVKINVDDEPYYAEEEEEDYV